MLVRDQRRKYAFGEDKIDSSTKATYYDMHEENVDKLRQHVTQTVNCSLGLCKVLINDTFSDVGRTLKNEKHMRSEIKKNMATFVNSLKFYSSIGIQNPEEFHKQLIRYSLNVTQKLWDQFSVAKSVHSERKFNAYVGKHMHEYHNVGQFDSKITGQPIGKAELLPPIRPPVNRPDELKSSVRSASAAPTKETMPALRKINDSPATNKSDVQKQMPALKPIEKEAPVAAKTDDRSMPTLRRISDDDEVDIAGPRQWARDFKEARTNRKSEEYAEKKERLQKEKEERKKKKEMKKHGMSGEWPGVDLVEYPKKQQIESRPPTSPTFNANVAIEWLRECVSQKEIQLNAGSRYVFFAPVDAKLRELEAHYANGGVKSGRRLAKHLLVKAHLAEGVHNSSNFETLSGVVVQKEHLTITKPVQTNIIAENSLKSLVIGDAVVTVMPQPVFFL